MKLPISLSSERRRGSWGSSDFRFAMWKRENKDATSFNLSGSRGFPRGVKVDFGWDIEYLFENYRHYGCLTYGRSQWLA